MLMTSKPIRMGFSLKIKKLKSGILATALLFLLSFNVFAQSDVLILNQAEEVFNFVKNLNKSNSQYPPTYVVFDKAISSKCGNIKGSAYCPSEHKIYLEKNQIRRLYAIGPEALDFIVAHEYAHAMQAQYGFGRVSTPLNELQADCLAGVYLNAKYKHSKTQTINALNVAFATGDMEWFAVAHHGFPEQRLSAFSIGENISIQSRKNAALACLEVF